MSEQPRIALRSSANENPVDAGLLNAPVHIVEILGVAVADQQSVRWSSDLHGARDRFPIRLTAVALFQSSAMKRDRGQLFFQKNAEPVFDNNPVISQACFY